MFNIGSIETKSKTMSEDLLDPLSSRLILPPAGSSRPDCEIVSPPPLTGLDSLDPLSDSLLGLSATATAQTNRLNKMASSSSYTIVIILFMLSGDYRQQEQTLQSTPYELTN